MDKQNKKEHKKILGLYQSEFIIFVVLGVLFLFGLVISILGMFAYNFGKLADNNLYQFQKSVATAFGGKEGAVADFRLIGSLIMVVIMFGFLISIYAYSLKESKEIAKKKRQEERLRILLAENETENNK